MRLKKFFFYLFVSLQRFHTEASSRPEILVPEDIQGDGFAHGLSVLKYNLLLCKRFWEGKYSRGNYEVQIGQMNYTKYAKYVFGDYWLNVGKVPNNKIKDVFNMQKEGGWRLGDHSSSCSNFSDIKGIAGVTWLIPDREFVNHYNHFMEHVLGTINRFKTYNCLHL